jgi:hypothetical protein
MSTKPLWSKLLNSDERNKRSWYLERWPITMTAKTQCNENVTSSQLDKQTQHNPNQNPSKCVEHHSNNYCGQYSLMNAKTVG